MPEVIVKLGDNVVHKYFFDKDILSIGRARDNDIVIENLSVSRNHARIRRIDGKYILTDLNSANGTYVNNRKVNKVEIVDKDIVTIGKHKIHFILKVLSDEQVISDAFGAERTMIVDKTPVARLTVTKGKQQGQEFKITKTETYIGRAGDNDIRLHDWFVSKKHAMILRQGRNFFIKDLKSWRGTMVNGKFTRESPLKDSDTLQFGSTIMTFKLAAEEERLKITGRVPREIPPEESAVYEAPPVVAKPPQPTPPPTEVEGISSVEAKARAEEEEAAKMQAAWEQLEEEPEKPVAAPAPQAPSFPSPEPVSIEAPGEEEIPGEKKAPEKEPEAAPAMGEEGVRPSLKVPADLPEGVDPREVELWLKALKNRSPVIRKNAAKRLKKLTGKDYDYE